VQGKKEDMTNEQSAFPRFLIRFTRAIQRNEKGWDALFSLCLGWNENKKKVDVPV
jgi:hypothetical protein